jgi:hypothetical protein
MTGTLTQTRAVRNAIRALQYELRSNQDDAEVAEQIKGDITALENVIVTLKQYDTLRQALKATLAD